MAPNPFIALAQDPVGTISAVGYLLLLVAILVVGIPHSVRTLGEVYQDWEQNAGRSPSKWKRVWGEGVGYLPPFQQALKTMWALFILFVAFESVAALLWFLGVTGVGA